MSFILSIDQGTTGTKALLVDKEGTIHGKGYAAHEQHYPQSGWVEHNLDDIWQCILGATAAAMKEAGVEPRDIHAVALANQGETVAAYARSSGRSLGNAIVWSDRRTEVLANAWQDAGWGPRVAERTGLRIDPYFSATKIQWLLQNNKDLQAAVAAGDAAVSTLDAWMIHRMTDGAAYITDASTVSRTLLYDLHANAYIDDHLEFLGIPKSLLSDIAPTTGTFGITSRSAFLGIEAPIVASIVDQPAALFGQGCLSSGDTKCTYGTGCFVYMNVGDKMILSKNDMLGALVWRHGETSTYALEGGVYSAGSAVDWACTIGIASDAKELSALAESVPDTQGVWFLPALTGMAAPFWDSKVRSGFVGLSAAVTRAHMARAVLEGIAHRVADVVEAMEQDVGTNVPVLRVDGGLTQSSVLMQMQANLLGVPVDVSAEQEATALGAASLAAIALGWITEDDVRRSVRAARRYTPAMSEDERLEARNRWRHVVKHLRNLSDY